MMVQVGIVYWEEEPGRERIVHAFCRRCQLSLRAYGEPMMDRLSDVDCVSPSGIGHAGHWDGYGMTACGIDGTRLDWWWRM